MVRPLTIYLISGWLAIWLLGIPVHNLPLLTYWFGTFVSLLFLALIFVATLVFVYQLLQSHQLYVDLALGMLSFQLGYLLTRFAWLLVHDRFSTYPLFFLIVLSINLYLVTYLMTPLGQSRIKRAHTSLRNNAH